MPSARQSPAIAPPSNLAVPRTTTVGFSFRSSSSRESMRSISPCSSVKFTTAIALAFLPRGSGRTSSCGCRRASWRESRIGMRSWSRPRRTTPGLRTRESRGACPARRSASRRSGRRPRTPRVRRRGLPFRGDELLLHRQHILCVFRNIGELQPSRWAARSLSPPPAPLAETRARPAALHRTTTLQCPTTQDSLENPHLNAKN